jgi:hypothetical protein
MKKVAVDQLPLLDLYGTRVNLSEYIQQYLLLIFLRHLA